MMRCASRTSRRRSASSRPRRLPVGAADLDRDAELRDSTLFPLLTMAESAQRLSVASREAHPEIPWSDIGAFRNRVVHGYLEADLDVVWAIIELDVPRLATCVREELERRRSLGEDRGPGLGL
jgi:uncharacterized protein with HEPN domain